MKYGWIFVLICLCCSGCSIHLPVNTTTLTGSSPVYQQIFSGGNFHGLSIISGVHNELIISGTTFVTSGIFSLRIPKGLSTWKYQGKIYTTNIPSFGYFFSINEDSNKKFTFRIDGPFPAHMSGSKTDLCTHMDIKDSISHSQQTKITQDKILYLDYITFASPDLETQPFEYQETRCCFVDQDLVYTISLGGYDQYYMNTIIDSLHFY